MHFVVLCLKNMFLTLTLILLFLLKLSLFLGSIRKMQDVFGKIY